METLEQIQQRILGCVSGCKTEIIPNGSSSAQVSLLVDRAHGLQVAEFLRDDPQLRMDYASNVTGVDWLDKTIKESRKTKQVIDGVEREIQETTERIEPGYLETVYHL